MDPTTLIIGDNVRAEARLDRQFLASIREFGVMDPIHVTRADDGTLTVKRGQRRTLGAVKVGRPTVPVLVVATHPASVGRCKHNWPFSMVVRFLKVRHLPPPLSVQVRGITPDHVDDGAVQCLPFRRDAGSAHGLVFRGRAQTSRGLIHER